MNKLLLNYIDNPMTQTNDALQERLDLHTDCPAAQKSFQQDFTIIEVTILVGLGFKVYNY
jgi:hypothetical protein